MSAVVLFNSVKQKLQCKALGFMLVIKAFIANGTAVSCNLGGFVGTVIRNNKNGNKLLWVILLGNTVKQITYNLFFVSCGNYNGIFVLLLCGGEFSCKEKPDYLIRGLINKHCRKHGAYNGVYRFKTAVPRSDFSHIKRR